LTAGCVLPAAAFLSGGKAVQKIRTASTQRYALGGGKIPILIFAFGNYLPSSIHNSTGKRINKKTKKNLNKDLVFGGGTKNENQKNVNNSDCSLGFSIVPKPGQCGVVFLES
jgi:hypothetical protein